MISKAAQYNERVREAVEWYTKANPLYAQLAQAAAMMAEEALMNAKIPYHSVAWRAKSISSYEKKAINRGYHDPRKDIRDMAGLRITTFVLSDAKKACRLVEQLFNVVETEDKSLLRQAGSFGYQSVHFTAYLPKDRPPSVSNACFNDMPIEIQVRTLLQHSWAEIEHDRNYKFEGTLPPELQHRFAMLAAVLELADREFDSIANDIDAYVANVKASTAAGRLDISINTASLREYLLTKLAALTPAPLVPRFATRRDAEEIVRELLGMGIDTLARLDAIIPSDFAEKARQHLKISTLAGIVRDILVIHNAEAYFRVTRSEHSQPIGADSLTLYAAYGIDPDVIRHLEASVTPEAFWRSLNNGPK